MKSTNLKSWLRWALIVLILISLVLNSIYILIVYSSIDPPINHPLKQKQFLSNVEMLSTSISDDGQRIAVSSYDKVFVLDNELNEIYSEQIYGSYAELSSNGNYLALIDNGLRLDSIDNSGSHNIWINDEFGADILDFEFSPDGFYIAAITSNSMYLFNMYSNIPIIQFHFTRLNCVDISNNGNFVVVGCTNGVYLLDKTGMLWQYNSSISIYDVAISDGGAVIGALDDNGNIYCFNYQSSTPLWAANGGDSGNFVAIPSIDISADGQYMACYVFNRISCYETTSNSPIWTYYEKWESGYCHVDISRDGSNIAAVGSWVPLHFFSDESGIPEWNSNNGFKLDTISFECWIQCLPVKDLDMTPDGKYIVIASNQDGTIFLYSNEKQPTPLTYWMPLLIYILPISIFGILLPLILILKLKKSAKLQEKHSPVPEGKTELDTKSRPNGEEEHFINDSNFSHPEEPPNDVNNIIQSLTSADIETAILDELKIATAQEKSEVTLISDEVCRKAGGSTGHDNDISLCCDIMKKKMGENDLIITDVSGGDYNSLKIKYIIPQGQKETRKETAQRFFGKRKGASFDFSAFMTLNIPLFMEPGTTSEIVLELNNRSDKDIKGIVIDFSDLEEFFEVERIHALKSLRPGMNIKKSIKLKPRHDEGTFPVIIKITSNGITVEKEYTIKVGGTEIY